MSILSIKKPRNQCESRLYVLYSFEEFFFIHDSNLERQYLESDSIFKWFQCSVFKNCKIILKALFEISGYIYQYTQNLSKELLIFINFDVRCNRSFFVSVFHLWNKTKKKKLRDDCLRLPSNVLTPPRRGMSS